MSIVDVLLWLSSEWTVGVMLLKIVSDCDVLMKKNRRTEHSRYNIYQSPSSTYLVLYY